MLAKQVIIAIIYLLAAKAGLLLAFEGTNVTPIWPATGIGLAALLLLGNRIWPAIFIGGFLANFSAFSSLGISIPLSTAGALFTTLGNTLEALLGAFLIRRFTSWPDPFGHHCDTVRFVLCSAVVATLVSATIGTSTQAVVIGNWENYGRIWITWWLGDGMGALVVAPLILTCKDRIREWPWRKAVEGAILLALLLVLGWVVFQKDYHVQYTLLFLLTWIVFRFGHFESSVTIVLLSIMAIMGTMQGIGPYVTPSLNGSLLLLQGYLATGSVMTMILSSLIAERKRSEVETQREKALLRCIIDSAGDLIFIKDSNSIYRGCNKASEKLVGLTESEQIGKSDYDFFDQEIAQLIQERDRKVIETGASLQTEEWMTYPDGRKVLLDTQKVPYYGVDGEVYGLVGISRDITERKRAEELLRKREQEFRSLAENSPDNIARYDAGCRLLYVNPALKRSVNIDFDARMGKTLLESPPGGQAEFGRYEYMLRSTLESGEPGKIEIDIPHPDGDYHTHQVLFVAERDEQGNVTGALTIGRDITERKRMEVKIRKLNEELEQRVQERTAELEGKNAELARLNRVFVGRELRMVELKERIKVLENSGSENAKAQ